MYTLGTKLLDRCFPWEVAYILAYLANHSVFSLHSLCNDLYSYGDYQNSWIWFKKWSVIKIWQRKLGFTPQPTRQKWHQKIGCSEIRLLQIVACATFCILDRGLCYVLEPSLRAHLLLEHLRSTPIWGVSCPLWLCSFLPCSPIKN
jgi:hypothetical protein